MSNIIGGLLFILLIVINTVVEYGVMDGLTKFMYSMLFLIPLNVIYWKFFLFLYNAFIDKKIEK